jgi:hypothetical protein
MEYVLNDEPLRSPLDGFLKLHNLLLSLPLDLMHENWFQRRAWIRSIHGTTHIEGNTLDPAQGQTRRRQHLIGARLEDIGRSALRQVQAAEDSGSLIRVV